MKAFKADTKTSCIAIKTEDVDETLSSENLNYIRK